MRAPCRIHGLPVEVMGEIFLCSVPKGESSPSILAMVCKRWYGIVMNTAALWCAIQLGDADYSCHTDESQYYVHVASVDDKLPLYLSRCNMLPRKLIVDFKTETFSDGNEGLTPSVLGSCESITLNSLLDMRRREQVHFLVPYLNLIDLTLRQGDSAESEDRLESSRFVPKLVKLIKRPSKLRRYHGSGPEPLSIFFDAPLGFWRNLEVLELDDCVNSMGAWYMGLDVWPSLKRVRHLVLDNVCLEEMPEECDHAILPNLEVIELYGNTNINLLELHARTTESKLTDMVLSCVSDDDRSIPIQEGHFPLLRRLTLGRLGLYFATQLVIPNLETLYMNTDLINSVSSEEFSLWFRCFTVWHSPNTHLQVLHLEIAIWPTVIIGALHKLTSLSELGLYSFGSSKKPQLNTWLVRILRGLTTKRETDRWGPTMPCPKLRRLHVKVTSAKKEDLPEHVRDVLLELANERKRVGLRTVTFKWLKREEENLSA